MSVFASFQDGSSAYITNSPDTQYVSSNIKVAVVDSVGRVLPIAPGRSNLAVSYSGNSVTVPILVQSFALRGDLNGDGVVDQSDLQVLVAALNTSSSGPGDPRDLNNDGRIDALDSQILATLCSRQNCATRGNKVIPSIIWPAPAAVTASTVLSSVQLNAAASVPGTFLYSPPSGTALNVGTQILSVNFTPNDAATYLTANASVTLQVNSLATPTIAWPKPADISFGTALGNGQLNATANVPGTFVYSPQSGAVLPVGNGETLSVRFTPNQATNYNPASVSTTINVLPGSGSTTRIIVTNALSRDGSNNIVVRLTLANAGTVAAANVALTSVKIGTVTVTPLLQAIGTIGANSLVQTTVTVPGSAGTPGTASSLTIAGTYTGGTFSATSRITLP